ncbi:MAG: MFS transporter [Acidimicrobiia bacterium]
MSDLGQLLRVRDFRLLWLAQIGSDFGDNLTFLSLMILVQRLTGSTVALAGLMIAAALPALVFGVLSGVYVDRFDRRRTMIVSDAIRGILILALVFVRSEAMLPLMYSVVFAQATIATLFNPARGALLPHIVGKERLLSANSVSQTSRVLFNVLGSGAAGVLASVSSSMSAAFIVDSATFLCSAIFISMIATRAKPAGDSRGAKALRDMAAGFRVMSASRPLKGILVGAALAMLGFGAVNVLVVPLLLDELRVSAAYLGLIDAAQVVGMIASGVLVAMLAARLRATTLVSAGLLGAGATIALVAGVDNVWQMAGVAILVGLMMTPVQSGVSTLSQLLVEDRMRGRVGGALNALISGASILSMAFAGVAAAAIGVRSVFVLAGVLAAAGGLISAFLFRGARLDTSPSSPVTQPV